MVERFHRNLKAALRARATGPTWSQQLPVILLFLRATPREDMPRSPAESVYGSQVVLPGQLKDLPDVPDSSFFDQLEKSMQGFKPVPPSHNIPAVERKLVDPPDELLAASRVFMQRGGARGPLEPVWEGPFKVLKRSRHVFLIQRGNQQETVSVLRLKPATVPADAPDATPKPRGRPRKQVTFAVQPQ